MISTLVHFAMLLAGGSLVWLFRPLRRDSIAIGLGFAIGASISFAINDSLYFLIVVPVFGLMLIWRGSRLRGGSRAVWG